MPNCRTRDDALQRVVIISERVFRRMLAIKFIACGRDLVPVPGSWVRPIRTLGRIAFNPTLRTMASLCCWCMALPGAAGCTQPALNAMADLLRGILQKLEVGGPVAVAGVPHPRSTAAPPGAGPREATRTTAGPPPQPQ